MKTIKSKWAINKEIIEKIIKKNNLNEKEVYFLLQDLNFDKENQKINWFIKNKIKKLKKIPLQYITKKAYFLDKEFLVNKNVLIPRFETEFVITNLIKFLKNNKIKPKSILDLGTGSGIIASTMKKEFPDANVYASDISKKALKVASFNFKKQKQNIKKINSDIFKNINKKFDLIISNPPYLKYDEIVDFKTLKNEPKIALFASQKGFYFYKKIILESIEYLNKDGYLCFETNDFMFEELNKLSNKNFKKIEAKKDYNDRERYILFKRKRN